MATHSSVLAWRILWTEEPGGLQSTGLKSWTQLSERARTHTHTHTHTPSSIQAGKQNLPQVGVVERIKQNNVCCVGMR